MVEPRARMLPSGSQRSQRLKRLQVLDDSAALRVGEVVAEGVAAVAAAGLRRVVVLAAVVVGQTLRDIVNDFDLPADVGLVKARLVGVERAREQLRPALGVEDAVDGGHGAVVEVRSGGPDAVEG